MTQHLLNPHPTAARAGDAVQVAVGADAVAGIERFASFIDGHSTVYCTTSAWLRAAAQILPGEPVVVTVHDSDADVVALAALSRVRRRGTWRIELLGGQYNDYGQLYHDTERAAGALAEGLVDWVRTEHRVWTLTLAQLPEHDVGLGGVLARLPGAHLVPGAPLPQIRGLGTDYVVSRNRRRKIKTTTNRIEADGLAWEQRVVEDRDELDRWLPAIVAVRRGRDHAVGRRSHLDDRAGLAFYEEFVRDLCDAGRLRLHLLLVDGVVAGYSMTALDKGVHRLFDGRVSEGLERYRGGMVCDLTAVLAASEDPTVTTFDWLRGSKEGKFGNHELQPVDLVATSHPFVDRLDRWDRTARQRVKDLLPEAVLQRIAAR